MIQARRGLPVPTDAAEIPNSRRISKRSKWAARTHTGTISTVALQFATTALASAFAIITARILGPHDRGLVVISLASVQMAGQFSTLGLNQSARTVAAQQGASIARSRIASRTPAILAANILIAATCAFSTLHPGAGSSVEPLVLTCFIVVISALTAHCIVLRDLAHGAGFHTLAQATDFTVWFIALSCMAVSYLVTGLSAIGATACLGFGYAVQLIILSLIMPASLPSAQWAPIALQIRGFLSNAGQYATMRIDKLMVGAVLGATWSGLYSVSSTLSEISWIPCILIAQYAARAAARSELPKLRLIRSVAFCSVTVWAILLIPLAHPIIDLLFGQEFSRAYGLVPPRSVSAAACGLAYIEIAVLVALHRERLASALAWSATIYASVLIAVSPSIGLSRALWAIAIGFVLVTTTALMVSRRELRYRGKP